MMGWEKMGVFFGVFSARIGLTILQKNKKCQTTSMYFLPSNDVIHLKVIILTFKKSFSKGSFRVFFIAKSVSAKLF